MIVVKDVRPKDCCGKCPPISGGGYDCTCEGNPRCVKPLDLDAVRDGWDAANEIEQREWALRYGDDLIAEVERLRAEIHHRIGPACVECEADASWCNNPHILEHTQEED